MISNQRYRVISPGRLAALIFFFAVAPAGWGQTNAPAAEANSAVARPAPAVQAPDDVMQNLSSLVRAERYQEAQQLTEGLLLAYPTDQRLIKAKAFLDKAVASAKPAEVAQPAEVDQPTASTAFSYAAGKNYTTTLPNNIALDMVWIPPGTFKMGSPLSEGGKHNEHPQHMVTISKGFWLGKMLVTQGQYQAVMGTNPSDFTTVGADAPVDTVSWDDAMEFCHKLTAQERAAGRLPTGYAYTLPTEAQWEYACRAGTTGALYGKLDEIAWYYGNSGDSTHPVGQKKPNAFGLYDMIGSVWEWCSDWYHDDYPDGNVTDPVGADSGINRVVRGGWWGLPAVYCRSAFRSDYDPSIHFDFIGFRLALAPSRKASAVAKAMADKSVHTQLSP